VTQRFFARNEACLFPKPAKQNGRQVTTIVLSGTRGPRLFLVIREGLGSGVRLGARSRQRLTYQLRLALEPECLENPTAPPEKIPGMERTRSETLKLFVVELLVAKLSSSVRSWFVDFLDARLRALKDLAAGKLRPQLPSV
jgi:hypothetical protein